MPQTLTLLALGTYQKSGILEYKYSSAKGQPVRGHRYFELSFTIKATLYLFVTDRVFFTPLHSALALAHSAISFKLFVRYESIKSMDKKVLTNL